MEFSSSCWVDRSAFHQAFVCFYAEQFQGYCSGTSTWQTTEKTREDRTPCTRCVETGTQTSLAKQPLFMLRVTLFSVTLGLCTWEQVPEQARRHWISWSRGGGDYEPLTLKCQAIFLAPWDTAPLLSPNQVQYGRLYLFFDPRLF